MIRLQRDDYVTSSCIGQDVLFGQEYDNQFFPFAAVPVLGGG
jgi:hypothetical protein